MLHLQAQGYQGGYSPLKDFNQSWREQEGKAASKAHLPLRFGFGEAFQFDWSKERRLALGFLRLDLDVPSELGHPTFSQAKAACLFHLLSKKRERQLAATQGRRTPRPGQGRLKRFRSVQAQLRRNSCMPVNTRAAPACNSGACSAGGAA